MSEGWVTLWELIDDFLTVLLVLALISLIVYVIAVALCILGQWKVLKKAGRPSWAALVPIYNVYELGKVAFPRKSDTVITTVLAGTYLAADVVMRIVSGGSSPVDLILSYSYSALSADELVGEVFALGVGATLLVFLVRMYVSLARSFGQSGWHALGFLIAPPVWWLLFGFEPSFAYRGQGGTGHPANYDEPAMYGGQASPQQACPYARPGGQAQPQQTGMTGQPQGARPDVSGQPSAVSTPTQPAPTSAASDEWKNIELPRQQ